MAITLVNHTLYNGRFSSSTSIPSTSAGNLLVVMGIATGSASPISLTVSDNASDVFTQVPWTTLSNVGAPLGGMAYSNLNSAFVGTGVDIWYCTTKGGATSIDVGTTGIEMWIYEFSGFTQWQLVDHEFSAFYSPSLPRTYPYAGPNLNGTQSDNIYLSLVNVGEGSYGGGVTGGVNSPWTIDYDVTGGIAGSWAIGFITDSTGVQQATFTINTISSVQQQNWQVGGAVFGPAPSYTLTPNPGVPGGPVTVGGPPFGPPVTVTVGGTPVPVIGTSPVVFVPGGPGLPPVQGPVLVNGTFVGNWSFTTTNFNYIKTFDQDDGQVNTFALDAGGILWEEDVTSNPNVLAVYDPLILPNTFAKSATQQNEEWIVFSNLSTGTDIPRHGSNLDRISQVGPGAGPAVVGQSGGTNVYSIVASPNGLTQTAAASDPSSPGNLFAANWSAGPFTTAPGNVFTVFYKDAVTNPTADPNLVVGGGVYISISSPAGLVGLTGTYVITSVGQGVPPGGNHACWYFTVQTIATGNLFQPGSDHITGTYQLSLATMTTTTPAKIQTGDSVTLAGVTAPAWDGTQTITATINGGQYQITATGLSSNVATYNYTPIGSSPTIAANELITVTGCTNGPIVNGTSIFNVSNATVLSATTSQFTLNLNGINVTTAAESGGAIVSGTIFQFDPGLVLAGTVTSPIFGNSGGGTVTVAGPLSSGVRQAVTIFQTRNGYLTAPSAPVVFETTGSDSVLQVSQIAVGPPNVIARIIAFTGANGGNFFYIPVPVTIQGAGQPTTYTATVINDNVTTSATFNFTDAVLLAATAIDIEGNNLFNEIELGSAAWNIAYADRMFYGLENNKVQNFTNLTFDGGYIPSPTGLNLPLGWTAVDGSGSTGRLVNSSIFGFAYFVTNPTGVSTGKFGMITQPAFQDAYKVPIILPNTTYSVRLRAQQTGSFTNGSLVIELFSPSVNVVYGSYSLPVSSMTTALGLFSGQLLIAPFQTEVPTDLQLRVYGQDLHTDTTFILDRFEIYPTNEPVLETEIQGSYVGNLEAFDGVTGPLGVGIQNNQPSLGAFINYDVLYILKTHSLLSTQDSPGNEPSAWAVREVSNKVGTCGVNAYDYGEEWAVMANRAGLYLFNGGEPVKISQEIQPTWDAINWLFGDTIWVRNDIVNRRILIGVPMATPNQWLPNAPTVSNPSSPNVCLMMNYRELSTSSDLANRGPVKIAFSGKLISWDMSRKWSIWQIRSPYADFIQRPDTTTPLFLCNGSSDSNIYTQVEGQLNDNGSPIDSLYTTYGFVKDSDRAQYGPVLSAHRNLYKYLDMNLYGSGTCSIKALPNVLNPTYPYTVPAISLSSTAQNNTERPINQTGNRLFLQFESSTLNSGFNVSSCTVTAVKDPHAPVRGLA